MADEIPIEDKKILTNIFTLKELFKIPIEAVIEANITAAESAVDFIRRYGFVRDKSGDPVDFGHLRMISFTYQYVDKAGNLKPMIVKMPLLSLIPLPFLEVKRAEFDFAVQIVDNVISHQQADVMQTPEVSSESVLALMVPLASVNEYNPTPRTTTSMEANMKVRVTVEQSDLPAGILQLLNLGQEATEGTTDYLYGITAKPSKLYFTPENDYTISMKVQVETVEEDEEGQKAPVDNQLVVVELASSTSGADHLFAQPIQVEKGDPVGIPTKAKAQALTNKNGVIEVKFEAIGLAGNGFIKIFSAGAPEVLIYFNIVEESAGTTETQ